jgi:uncharacterized membrane protein
MGGALVGYLQDWLNLLLRWAHFITGVAWIGASFYFNWLENHLERQQSSGDRDIAGDLWAVHGGGFYYLQKYEVAPPALPPTLHWFKYEAYFTWITGFALLCTLYYWNAGAFMIDRSVADIGPLTAIGIGIGSLLLSWFFYDGLCRSPLRENNLLLGVIIFGWFTGLAWILSDFLSGRAAYIHVGAAIGTIMVANVFTVIIPSQKDLVAAVGEGREPDGAKGRNALLRSRHNNYFTLPVLFIMISNHYPSTYGNANNWLILAVISLAGVGIRHYFNVRHLEEHKRWVLPVSLAVLAIAVVIARPASLFPKRADRDPTSMAAPTTTDILPIIRQRCAGCHAEEPELAGFVAPPLGIELETTFQVESEAPRVLQATVMTRTMPLGNLTQMTEDERDMIARWYKGRLNRDD